MAKTPKKDSSKSSEPKAGLPSTKVGGAMMVTGDKVPDYIKPNSARGTENLTTSDLVIPRLEVIQAIGPQVEKDNAGFIPGAVAGMLNNSVTRELYGDSVLVVPVHYTVQYLVWKDRKKGGGFFGAYNTLKEAQARAEQEGGKKADIEVLDTPTHLCLLLNQAKGTAEEVMISMPRTKAKISRQWNSAVMLSGGDRFARVYKVSSASAKNTKGTFHNFAITPTGFPSKEVYARAEELYGKITSGERKMNMDTRFMDGERTADDGTM